MWGALAREGREEDRAGRDARRAVQVEGREEIGRHGRGGRLGVGRAGEVGVGRGRGEERW